jgi:hypothetical protein
MVSKNPSRWPHHRRITPAHSPQHGIISRCFQFARISVWQWTARGASFLRSIPVGMPKIPASTKNAAFYLYPTVEDARKGTNFGGSGFLVLIPSKKHAKYGLGFLYAVTNWHVAVQGNPIIRLNMHDGGMEIIAAEVDNWEFDPRYDIAVLLINVTLEHNVAIIARDMLLTKAKVAASEIGPGDDVFMVGRFMDHDGGLVNVPAVRFGNISIDPTPIKQSNGHMADSYCIDLHSRSGYSWSPVFVYRTVSSDLTAPHIYSPETQVFSLLGIHFAQFPEMWEVTSQGKLLYQSAEPLLTDGKYIRGYSGMTLVLPAWTIQEVLDMPKLKIHRAELDELTEARFKAEGYPPLIEAAASSPESSSLAADENAL